MPHIPESRIYYEILRKMVIKLDVNHFLYSVWMAYHLSVSILKRLKDFLNKNLIRILRNFGKNFLF